MTLFGGVMDCNWRWPSLLGALLTILCLSTQLVIAADVDSTKDDLAAQIRDQAYGCAQPQSGTRDAQASKPDEEVWLLRCEGASYRVRLIPDMAAQGERARSTGSSSQHHTSVRPPVCLSTRPDFSCA